MEQATGGLRVPVEGEYVRHVGTLVKVEVVQPPPKPRQEFIFEEVEARCELRVGDYVVKTLSTYTDFYGLNTCVSNAIEDMLKFADSHHITPQSDLELVVIRVVSQYRKVPLRRKNFFAKDYCDFEPLERGATLNLPDPTETIVWSSKTGAKR